MPRSVGTYRGTSAAVLLILIIARQSGVSINRTKLAKLLYLADLRAVEHGLPPGSDVEWRWRNYGPHSATLQDVEDDLRSAHVIDVSRTLTNFGVKEIRLKLVDATPQLELDQEFIRIVEDIMNEFAHQSATQLKNFAYQTSPMLAAKRKGKREVRLDLAGGNPYPDIAPAITRLRRVLAEMPPQTDDPGGVEELAAEMEDWAPLGRRAVSQMLDAE